MGNITPKVKNMTVIPVAGHDSMLMTLSGVHAPYFTRNIVIIEDTSGNIGVGEVHGGDSITKNLNKYKEIVLDRSISDYRKIIDDINQTRKIISSEGIQNFNILKLTDIIREEVAIESALLDLFGQYLNVPVCSLLGSGKQRNEIDVLGYLFYINDVNKINLPYITEEHDKKTWFNIRRKVSLTADSIVNQAEIINEQYGIKDFKLKAGVLDPEIEILTIKKLKKVFPYAHLSFDPNGAWSLEEAIRLCNEVKYDISYVEDPCGAENGYSGREILSEFRQATGIPVATNMVTTNLRQLLPSIILKSVDIVLADPNFWLMSGSVAISELLNHWGMQWGCHSNNHFDISLAIFTHCAASAKGKIIPIDTHWIWQDGQNLCDESYEIRDGKIIIGDRPGLGIKVNMEKIIKANKLFNKIDKVYKNRDDSLIMQKIIPGWKFDPKTPSLIR